MIYGPFYLLLVYSFIKGKNWIRPMALVCTSAARSSPRLLTRMDTISMTR
jgi:hypothetical protein